MNRQQIIQLLDKPFISTHDAEHGEKSPYDTLKDCVTVDFSYESKIFNLTLREIDEFSDSRVDEWFAGVIESLYYRPNHKCLVLLGSSSNFPFFMQLFPEVNPHTYEYSVEKFYKDYIYKFMFINNEFQKNTLDIVERDEFDIFPVEFTDVEYGDTIKLKYPVCDKRLASYCSTTNIWPYPQRKNFIVHKVNSIDWEMYDSIDKLQLWIEIFNKFKPKDK